MLVSIIVPIYKVEKYLPAAVDSLLSQTYQDIEVILIDDGSPDNCPSICDEYAHKDDRITVIHKQNGGLSDARNAGIEAAHGEYIMFLDSDDIYRPDMVEKLINAAVEKETEIVLCNITAIEESGKAMHSSPYPLLPNGVFSSKEAMFHLTLADERTWTVVWNKIYHKDVWDNIRFLKGKIHEDVFVMHYLLEKANNVGTISESCYLHRERAGSIMTTRNEYSYLCGLNALCDRIKFFSEKGMVEAAGRASNQCFEMIRSAYWRGYLENEQIREAVIQSKRTMCLLSTLTRIRYSLFWKCPNLERIVAFALRMIKV